MRNYPLRNKYKQAAKKLAYIVSRISEPLSYRDIYCIWGQLVTNIKPSDMAHIRLRKDVYILFYINFKQMKKNVKKLS